LAISDLKMIVKNKKYMIFVVIVFLLYALGCADMYIVVDKILAIDGSKWIVGMKWGLQSLFEIPILLIGNRLLKKYGVYKLMIFSCSMFLIRFLIYAWIQIPIYFLYASIFQLVTFPIVVFCSKEEFDELIDERLKTTAQMFAMSIYMGVSLFVMPIFCNYLVQSFGYDISLYIVSLFSILTIVLLCIYKKL
ncbi:MAG: MFS transporter, partial [Erysipelotrichaceae bacterium]|nr:MFS transporter [Erysipelotrichaceae bacterium]